MRENDIKMDQREIGCEYGKWLEHASYTLWSSVQ
jgi:hypothetical protein